MNAYGRFSLLALLAVAMSGAARAADIVMRASFDEGTAENFAAGFPGASLAPSDADFSTGTYSLRCAGEDTVDVERYIKYSDKDTKVGFHYKAEGMRIIRVLAQSIEDTENLYYNLTNVPQGQWEWAVVKMAELRNVVPKQGGPERPFGNVTGKGKTFKNIVFHLMGIDKKAEQPVVHLDNIAIYSGADTQPPVLNGKVAVNSDKKGTFLSWPDAKDDVGVAYYQVFKGSEESAAADAAKPAGVTVAPEFTIEPGPAWYRVVAVDYAGNRSKPSAAVTAGK